MKTPHAVLIGLSLIAAAIYFKEPFVKPAHAFGGPHNITCFRSPSDEHVCYLFKGDTAKVFVPAGGINASRGAKWNWKTGARLN